MNREVENETPVIQSKTENPELVKELPEIVQKRSRTTRYEVPRSQSKTKNHELESENFWRHLLTPKKKKKRSYPELNRKRTNYCFCIFFVCVCVCLGRKCIDLAVRNTSKLMKIAMFDTDCQNSQIIRCNVCRIYRTHNFTILLVVTLNSCPWTRLLAIVTDVW